MNAPSPSTLYYEAAAKHPNDLEARRAMYLDLMRKHGHVVTKDPTDHSPLFACGYDPKR